MSVVKKFCWSALLFSLPLVAPAEIQVWPGPLAGAQGHYNGLIYEDSGIVHQHAGYFSLDLWRSGRFSGFAIIGGEWFWLDRPFRQPSVDEDGHVRIGLWQGWFWDWRQRYTMELQFDLTNGTDQVTGTLDNSRRNDDGDHVPATWTATVLGDRDTFHSRTNPAPQAGTYTMVIPGGDGVNEPAGAGSATIRVDSSGNVRVSGLLADGTFFSQASTLAKDGRWPFYTSLYGDRGSLIGWVTFSDLPDSDLAGTLLWTRPRNSWAFSYRNGFTNEVEAIGSRFVARRNLGQALSLTNGVATFSEAGLDEPVVDTFRISSSGKVINTSDNRFSLAFINSLGTFRGTFSEPGSSRTMTFRGAYLQKQSKGYGYFFGRDNESGLVTLEPEP
jgi:hypothetical protein